MKSKVFRNPSQSTMVFQKLWKGSLETSPPMRASLHCEGRVSAKM